jgi:hypothetical protein
MLISEHFLHNFSEILNTRISVLLGFLQKLLPTAKTVKRFLYTHFLQLLKGISAERSTLFHEERKLACPSILSWIHNFAPAISVYAVSMLDAIPFVFGSIGVLAANMLGLE